MNAAAMNTAAQLTGCIGDQQDGAQNQEKPCVTILHELVPMAARMLAFVTNLTWMRHP